MPHTSPGGGKAEGDFSVCLANFSPCSLSLAPEIRTQSSRATCMIETAYVRVCSPLCLCVAGRHMSLRRVHGTPVAPSYMFPGTTFQMDFGRLLFYHISSMHGSTSQPHWLCPLFLAPYLLISVLVTLNQQNGTYWCKALQFLALNRIGREQLMEKQMAITQTRENRQNRKWKRETVSQSSKQMRLCLPWPAVYITVLLCVSTERLQCNIIIWYTVYFPFSPGLWAVLLWLALCWMNSRTFLLIACQRQMELRKRFNSSCLNFLYTPICWSDQAWV